MFLTAVPRFISSLLISISVLGGIRKIPGMHYIEGNEPPKSSRQLFWRSSVEMSRNAAQLALQVPFSCFLYFWIVFVCCIWSFLANIYFGQL